MNRIQESLYSSLSSQAHTIACLHRVIAAANELKLEDLKPEPSNFDFSYIGWEEDYKPTITLSWWESGIALSFRTGLEMVKPGNYMAQAARKLLPLVHRFDKGYNEAENKLTLTAEYKGVKIVLTSAPPSTCTVEKIEEEIDVPAEVIPEKRIEAHKETRVRFVMKGDCNPLLASAEAGQPSATPEPAEEASAASEADSQSALQGRCFLVEGKWSGYHAGQSKVAHVEVVGEDEAEELRTIQTVEFGDGTTLAVTVREITVEEARQTICNFQYKSVLRDFIRRGFTGYVRIDDLQAKAGA